MPLTSCLGNDPRLMTVQYRVIVEQLLKTPSTWGGPKSAYWPLFFTPWSKEAQYHVLDGLRQHFREPDYRVVIEALSEVPQAEAEKPLQQKDEC